jgi:hypothetical protein
MAAVHPDLRRHPRAGRVSVSVAMMMLKQPERVVLDKLGDMLADEWRKPVPDPETIRTIKDLIETVRRQRQRCRRPWRR